MTFCTVCLPRIDFIIHESAHRVQIVRTGFDEPDTPPRSGEPDCQCLYRTLPVGHIYRI